MVDQEEEEKEEETHGFSSLAITTIQDVQRLSGGGNV